MLRSLVVKKLDTGSSLPGFMSWPCYLLVVRPLASYLTSLGLNFLICNVGIMIINTSQDCQEDFK